MLTALLLQRIVRHKVVEPFPEEGTYHDRWYRDRRRRRANAQWQRRLLSPTRDRGRKPWYPELPVLVVTDENGTEYRDIFPPAKSLARTREISEDWRIEESLHERHLLQVPGNKGAEKSHLDSSSGRTRHGAAVVSSKEEGESQPKVSYNGRQSQRFDRNYDENESSTSVGQDERADRRDNTARENTYNDGYRLHHTSINASSKQCTGSHNEEQNANIETSSTERQAQAFEGRYVGEEVVYFNGRRDRTEEREIFARENGHGDEYRPLQTSINATSRHSSLSTTEERQVQGFDRRYAADESVLSVGQYDKAIKRENNDGHEYRLRHTSVTPATRHGTESISEENKLSSFEMQDQRFDRRYTEEKHVVSKGQGHKDGGRQNTRHENSHDDKYGYVHTTYRHSTESRSEEGKTDLETSSHEIQEEGYVEEEIVPSNGQGDYIVKEPDRVQDNNHVGEYRSHHSTSRHSTGVLSEEHRLYHETSYKRQEQRFNRYHVEAEFRSGNSQGDDTVKDLEGVQNNYHGDEHRSHHSTSRHSTAESLSEEHSSVQDTCYEKQGQRSDGRYEEEESWSVNNEVEDTIKGLEGVQNNNHADEYRSYHSTSRHSTSSALREQHILIQETSHEKQGQCFNRHHEEEEFRPVNNQRDDTLEEPKALHNNNYGDEYPSRAPPSTYKQSTVSQSEDGKSDLSTHSYEKQGQRFDRRDVEEELVPSVGRGRGDHTEPENIAQSNSYGGEYRTSQSASTHSTVSMNEEHTSYLEPSFYERQGQRIDHDRHHATERFVPTVYQGEPCAFCGAGYNLYKGIVARENSNGDGYRQRQTSIRTIAKQIKECLDEISKLRAESYSIRRQERRFDWNYVEKDSVQSKSQRYEAEEREYNHVEEFCPRYTPTNAYGPEFNENVPHGKDTGTRDVSEGGAAEESAVYEDLLLAQGNQRRETRVTSNSSSTTSHHSTVSEDEERKTYFDERQRERFYVKEESVPSGGQGDKDGGRENNHGDRYHLQHTPISTISEKSAVSSTEERRAYTNESSIERQSCPHDRQYVEEEESWHAKCQHGSAVEWGDLAGENKHDNKSRLRRMPIKVVLREVYTDKWRQYMNVCQEPDVVKTESDEESTHTRQKDDGTYVSQRTIRLRKASGDAWREQQPEAIHGETSVEGGGERKYAVTGRDHETGDPRFSSVFEDIGGEDEGAWQGTEDSRHRSVFEDDHGEQEERNSFFEEWSSLRYTDEAATDFAEWSWLLTMDPRAREDVSEDGETSYNSAEYLAKRQQRLMDLVDGFDEEQLSRLEWFLRQMCHLEEDLNQSLDKRSFDFSEFRADLEFVARTYFDIELRDLELSSKDSHNDYISDEESDLETIPESDHEYDADDDGYEMSPSPAPLTSSRVDLHNITTTKGLKRWDSRDSAIGSSVGGTLRSWGSQSTVDGTSDTSGFRLSLDSDVFYFGDMSKYGRKSFGSTPYLSRESYC